MDDVRTLIRDMSADACGSALRELWSSPRPCGEGADADAEEPRALAFGHTLLAGLSGEPELVDAALARLLPHLEGGSRSSGRNTLETFCRGLPSIVATGDWERLRRLFEVGAQRNPWIVRCAEDLLALDARLVAARREAPGDRFDFSDSSYNAWIEGLAAFAAGDVHRARDRLRTSEKRYLDAGLRGDAAWSRFDLALIAIHGGEFADAGELIDTLPAEKGLSLPLRSFGQKALRAFTTMDLAAWEAVVALMTEGGELANDVYRSIFLAMTKALQGRRRRCTYILCRPATEDMIDGLQVIAEETRLPSQPTEKAGLRALVERSLLTLSHDLAWSQGTLYLAALKPSDRGDDGEVIGTGQISIGGGGHWRRRRAARYARRMGADDRVIYQDFLIFKRRLPEEIRIEMAGNSVRRDHRSQRIGSFITESRVLFLRLHGREMLKAFGPARQEAVGVYANLLPAKSGNEYPFFESVVRPLIDNLPYEQADRARYEGLTILEDLLSATGGGDRFPDTMIPLPLLSPELRQALGNVRDETRPAQSVLERFGFRRSDNFDALDAGQYFEIPLEQLLRVIETHEMTALRGDKRALSNATSAFYATVAPATRSMSEFVCVRALVQANEQRPDELTVDSDAASAIGLGPREPIVLLGSLRHASPRNDRENH